MEIGTVKISVDTTEIDNATKKLIILSALLDKVQVQLNSLSGHEPSVSAIDSDKYKTIFHNYNHLGKLEEIITKSTLR